MIKSCNDNNSRQQFPVEANSLCNNYLTELVYACVFNNPRLDYYKLGLSFEDG